MGVPLMEYQEIGLWGGPFDGDVHLVDPERDFLTISYRTGVIRERFYGKTLCYVVELGAADYIRVSDTVFEHCRPHTAMGELEHLADMRFEEVEDDGT